MLFLISIYCLIYTVALYHYETDTEAFTGQAAESVGCFVENNSYLPSSEPNDKTTNMAVRFHWLMWLGFRIHLFGFFVTLMFASRLYFESKKRGVDTCLLVMIAFYTIVWVIWLLSLIVLRFCEFGRVCSGAYLEPVKLHVQPGYAI